MKSLIIFESFFSNTEKIARSIGEGMECHSDILMLKYSDFSVEYLKNTDIFVVGAPTRGFNPSENIKNLLKTIPSKSLKGIKTVAFDTRIPLETVNSKFVKKMMNFAGYAAEKIDKKLIKKGGHSIVPPCGFYVLDTKGPLQKGEIERAKSWGEKICIMAQQS